MQRVLVITCFALAASVGRDSLLVAAENASVSPASGELSLRHAELFTKYLRRYGGRFGFKTEYAGLLATRQQHSGSTLGREPSTANWNISLDDDAWNGASRVDCEVRLELPDGETTAYSFAMDGNEYYMIVYPVSKKHSVVDVRSVRFRDGKNLDEVLKDFSRFCRETEARDRRRAQEFWDAFNSLPSKR